MAAKTAEKPQAKTLPTPRLALGGTVEEHIAKRLAEMGIVPQPSIASIPSPVRDGPQPKQEDTRHSEVLAEAIENQKYYMERAKATGKPWFQNPRKNHQYSEHIFVTIPMGEELMQWNKNPRSFIDPAVVEGYYRDLTANHWMQSGESIQIDLAGYMFDGQHRITALLKTGRGYVFYITFQVPCEARLIVDSGKKRNPNQKMAVIYGDTAGLGNKCSAVCKAMMWGTQFRTTRLTETEVFEFRTLHNDTLTWISKHIPSVRADLQAAVGKAMLWFGPEAINVFCERYRHTIFPTESDPVGMLYKFCHKKQKYKVPGDVVYRKTIAAINHFLASRQVTRLVEDQKDFFEWDIGWKVPANAPAFLVKP